MRQKYRLRTWFFVVVFFGGPWQTAYGALLSVTSFFIFQFFLSCSRRQPVVWIWGQECSKSPLIPVRPKGYNIPQSLQESPPPHSHKSSAGHPRTAPPPRLRNKPVSVTKQESKLGHMKTSSVGHDITIFLKCEIWLSCVNECVSNITLLIRL